MFEIFHPQNNAGFKTSYTNAYDNFYLIKFEFRVVRKRICYPWWNLFFEQVKPFIDTYIFVAFLGTGNKNVHLIALPQL